MRRSAVLVLVACAGLLSACAAPLRLTPAVPSRPVVSAIAPLAPLDARRPVLPALSVPRPPLTTRPRFLPVLTPALVEAQVIIRRVAPTIIALSPSSGAVAAVVTITGLDFGTSQENSVLRFNGTTATPSAWSSTSITVAVPVGATTGSVTIIRGGLTSNALTFTVSASSTAGDDLTVINCATSTCRYLRTGATGTGTGLDWTNAYTTLAALETGLPRGGYGFYADGTYAESVTFNTPVSGTLVNEIRKATVLDHGTSTGWLDTYGDGMTTFSGGWIVNSSYWKFNGKVGGGPGTSIPAGGFATWAAASWVHGFQTEHSVGFDSSNIDFNASPNITNITFSHFKFNSDTPVACDGICGSGNYGNIFHSETDQGHLSVSNLTVEYAWFTPFTGVVCHCKYMDTILFQYTFTESNGITDLSVVHREFLSAINTDRVTLRWNYWLNMGNSAIVGYVNNGDCGQDLEVYGNIEDTSTYNGAAGTHSPGYMIDQDAGTGCNSKYANNTVVNWKEGAASWNYGAGGTGYVLSNLHAYHHMTWGDINQGNETTTNNSFYELYRWDAPACPCPLSVGARWAGFGTGGQLLVADPFVDYANRDLRLSAAGAAAMSAGSLTNSPAGNSRDMFGCARGGVDGKVDRGALEYPAC